ncbi:hypothetical protein D3C85_1691530 [compost metagenome]
METLNWKIPLPISAKAANNHRPTAVNSFEYNSTVSCKLSEADCQIPRIGLVKTGQLAVFLPGGGIRCSPFS